MLFKKKFEVVTICESGVVITDYLKGKRKDVNKDIKTFKKNAKEYQMVGKNGMIVWVQQPSGLFFSRRLHTPL